MDTSNNVVAATAIILAGTYDRHGRPYVPVAEALGLTFDAGLDSPPLSAAAKALLATDEGLRVH